MAGGVPVMIVGELFYTSLGIGGGPIQPPAGGGSPPGIWGPPGPWPTPPIAPGGPPPIAGWTPPGYHPSHPIAPGGPPPVATPPIYYPPGIWPPPGGPVYPAHPIAPGGPPPGIWGPTDPRPTHPIVIPMPPVEIPPPEGGGEGKKLEVKAVWTAQPGWFVVAIPGEGTEVPTPSQPPQPS